MELHEFAKEARKKTGDPAWYESLPPEVLEEIRKGRKIGLGATIIARWLKSEGYPDATPNRVTSFLRLLDNE